MCRPALENLPSSLWSEAFNWAVYLHNCLPHSALNGKSPFELLNNRLPSIKHLRPFGTSCIVHIPKKKRPAGSKLEPRGVDGKLVGYTETPSMFRVYIPSQTKVDTFRQVKFIPSNDQTSVEMYLPLELTFSEPDQVAISTTDQSPPPLLQINTPETPQKPQRMPGAFGSPMPMKPPSAPPLPVPSAPLPTISLPSGSLINPADYETFDDSEELSESERVVS